MFPTPPVPRRAGVIMHPTSLPGMYGIGDMGSEAYAFVDWLADAKMQIWQVLPLVPPGRPIPGVREDYWSPYSGRDAHCGNTLIISLSELVKDGLLTSDELPHPYNIAAALTSARSQQRTNLFSLRPHRASWKGQTATHSRRNSTCGAHALKLTFG